MVDPGFSEWEGMFLANWEACWPFLTKDCMKKRKSTPKWGACILHTLLTRLDVKNTETNIVFNDDYIVINYTETSKTFKTSI